MDGDRDRDRGGVGLKREDRRQGQSVKVGRDTSKAETVRGKQSFGSSLGDPVDISINYH